MAAPQTFDLARSTYDSWPWMFGKQWDAIVERSREDGGIEAAAPQVHLLLAWCAVFEEEEVVMEKVRQVERLQVEGKNGRPEPAPEWMKLQTLLLFCIRIAKDSGAWLFREGEREELVVP